MYTGTHVRMAVIKRVGLACIRLFARVRALFDITVCALNFFLQKSKIPTLEKGTPRSNEIAITIERLQFFQHKNILSIINIFTLA